MKQFITVDVSPYFNRRIVFDPKSSGKIIGYGGDAYSARGFFTFGETWTAEDGIPYLFERNGYCDNLVAEGQRIEVPRGRYSTLHLAGFMHWGTNCDEIVCHYTDGTRDGTRFCFFDWCHDCNASINNIRLLPEFQDVKVLKQCISCCDSPQGYKGPMFVYGYPCSLNPSKELAAIELPDNMFLYLFAVTLEAHEDETKADDSISQHVGSRIDTHADDQFFRNIQTTADTGAQHAERLARAVRARKK